MTTRNSPRYWMITCNEGSEKGLKSEVANFNLEVSPAFSRPGFVTFKQEGLRDIEGDLNALVLAQRVSLVLGRGNESEVGEILANAPLLQHYHVWSRTPEVALAAPLTGVYEHIKAWRNLETRPGDRSHDRILDIVQVDPGLIYVGTHTAHGLALAQYKAANPGVVPPENSPSRAWSKIEEMLAGAEHFGLKPLPGQTIVEVGSSPGGACRALLDRDLWVVGIDPGLMDESLLGHPHFMHLKRGVEHVWMSDIPQKIHWLAWDLNIGPRTSIALMRDFIEKLDTEGKLASLQGIIVTFKINNWDYIKELPQTLRTFRQITRCKDLWVKQMPSHKQEFGALAVI